MRVEPETNKVIKAGEQQFLNALIYLENGYHVQAAKVADANLIPMKLSLESTAQITTGEPVFPPWKEKTYYGSTFQIYENTLKVTIPVKTVKGLNPGSYTLAGKVDYQACTETSCLLPRTEHFKFSVKVI